MSIRECPEDRYTSLTHNNGDLLCAVAMHTTGHIPYHNHLCQIAVMPLDANIKPIKSLLPFICDIVPRQSEHIDPNTMSIKRAELLRVSKDGIPFTESGDLFMQWIRKKWKLPEKRKIIPLCYNYPIKFAFLQDWLYPYADDIFAREYRDPIPIGLFINDYYDVTIQKLPFGNIGFGSLCNKLDIVYERGQDLLVECTCIGEIHRKMVRSYHLTKISPPPIHYLPVDMIKKELSENPLTLDQIKDLLNGQCSLVEVMHCLVTLYNYKEIEIVNGNRYKLLRETKDAL